jgi:hypothetical protein
MRRATRVMNAGLGGQQAARLLGGCRSASIWRSDKTKDSIVSDPVQDLNPQSTREKRFADEDTRPISTLSQDTAAGNPRFYLSVRGMSLTNFGFDGPRCGPENGPARGGQLLRQG